MAKMNGSTPHHAQGARYLTRYKVFKVKSGHTFLVEEEAKKHSKKHGAVAEVDNQTEQWYRSSKAHVS